MHGGKTWMCLGIVALVVTGCSKNTVHTPMAAKPSVNPDKVVVTKKEDGPPRKPTPELCLRAGQVKESLAEEAKDNATRETLYGHAKLAYQQAIDLDPNCREAKLSLARLYEKTGNPQQTVAMLQECIKQKPADAVLWYELGMCYGRQKHWDSSIQCLQKAASLAPGNTTYANHLGFSLARAGRYEESFEYFRAAVGEAQAHVNLAKMMNHVGQTEYARQHAEAALQLEPRLAEARQMLDTLNQGQGIVQASATVPQ